MRERILSVLGAMLLVTTLMVSGGTAAGAPFKACLVTDVEGTSDSSGFGAASWAGIQRVGTERGIDAQLWVPASELDYEADLQAAVDAGCDVTVASTFFLREALTAVAPTNPSAAFFIVDAALTPQPDNVRDGFFDVYGGAFMAGYLAAGMTSTGVVGTYGGMPFPSVTAYMDGFYFGVDYYNSTEGSAVQVLGWDALSQTGTFLNSFWDQSLGEAVTLSQIGDGADVFLPVAGPAGFGSVTAAYANQGTAVIGVDNDWYDIVDHPEVMLTSVVKNVDQMVFDEVIRMLDGGEAGGTSVANIQNDGVDVAPFHDWASDVPADLVQGMIAVFQQFAGGGLATNICDGLPATLMGTPEADGLMGSPGRDVIVTMGGDDLIIAGRGDDIVCSGEGNDTVKGGPGDDIMYGEGGNDLIRGLTGNDISYGGPGDDKIQDGPGLDLLYGEAGKDKMWGGNDDDVIYGGEGNDQIHGGRHNDELHGGGGTDRIWGDSGNDTLYGEGRSDFLYGGIDVDTLYGGVGNDRLFGGTGNDFLYGETGRDQLRGQDGDDANDGGPQHDWCSFETIWLNCEKEL